VTRSPLPAALRAALVLAAVVLAGVAGCADEPAPGAPSATPAPLAPSSTPPTTTVVGQDVPPLVGDPTDTTQPTQARAGEGPPPTGLVTRDVVPGTGPGATLDDTVAVRYTGTLYSDGTLFDSSWGRGDDPVSFPLEQVVPGFAQGIEGMQVGGRRVIVIPPDLGYGANDNGPIPGGSTLVFVVDLVGIT
jgi:peptidylprolyl isomerase